MRASTTWPLSRPCQQDLRPERERSQHHAAATAAAESCTPGSAFDARRPPHCRRRRQGAAASYECRPRRRRRHSPSSVARGWQASSNFPAPTPRAGVRTRLRRPTWGGSPHNRGVPCHCCWRRSLAALCLQLPPGSHSIPRIATQRNNQAAKPADCRRARPHGPDASSPEHRPGSSARGERESQPPRPRCCPPTARIAAIAPLHPVSMEKQIAPHRHPGKRPAAESVRGKCSFVSGF